MTKNINGGTATATFNDLNITGNVGGCVNAMTATNAGVVTIEGNCSPGVQEAVKSIASSKLVEMAWNQIDMSKTDATTTTARP